MRLLPDAEYFPQRKFLIERIVRNDGFIRSYTNLPLSARFIARAEVMAYSAQIIVFLQHHLVLSVTIWKGITVCID